MHGAPATEAFKLPPTRIEEKAAVELARTVARMVLQGEQLLRAHGLTTTQYNALRIINGAGPDGVCGTQVRDRLIANVPDVTRLLDRLEEAGLISRERDAENRRFVTARITAAGQRRLEETAPKVSELHQQQFARFTQAQIRTLLELLKLTHVDP